MKIFKENLPWVASLAVLLFLGANFIDKETLQFETTAPAVVEATPARVIVQPESTLDAIAAVQPEPTLDAIANVTPQIQNTTAQELSLILQGATQPEVTRTATLETSIAPVAEVAEDVTPPSLPEDPTAFFAVSQANLAPDDACGDDLRALANEARIYFPSGGLAGADAGLNQARLLAKVLADCPGYIVQVEGHSDPSGDPDTNLAISKQRAETVVNRIGAAGIDTSKLVAIGYGDQRPSNIQGTQEPAYYDRRVEFTVVAQDQVQQASFSETVTPTVAACVKPLETLANQTTVYYAPRSITVPSTDLTGVMQLALEVATCDGAKLRIIGQHLNEPGMRETATTGRHRALAIMNTLVAAGISADQIVIGAPSWSEAIPGQPGLPNSRVDFQIVASDG